MNSVIGNSLLNYFIKYVPVLLEWSGIHKLPISLNLLSFSGNTSLNKTGSARNSTDCNGIDP